MLDPKNEHDYVQVDSAYSGRRLEDLLNLCGFESLIYQNEVRKNLLSEDSKDLSRVISAIRPCFWVHDSVSARKDDEEDWTAMN